MDFYYIGYIKSCLLIGVSRWWSLEKLLFFIDMICCYFVAGYKYLGYGFVWGVSE